MSSAWAIYDTPEMLAAITTPLPNGHLEVLLAVDGVHCGGCARGVERALAGCASQVRVSVVSRTVEFLFQPAQQPLSQLIERLEQAGYQPQVMAQDAALPSARRARRAALSRVGIAVLCAMQVMMLAWPEYQDAASIDKSTRTLLHHSQWLLATPAVFYSGWPFLAGAWCNLRAGRLGMDVPVAASILIAYGASVWHVVLGTGALYFDAATMFVMLLGLGRYLEGRSRAEAGERIRLLAGRRALTAKRIEADGPQAVPIASLQIGDRVLLAPGEAVPCDGLLQHAACDFDESLLTGESRPVRHEPQSLLLGGSIQLGLGTIEMTVTQPAASSRLAGITRSMQEAQGYKPRAQALADRVARSFVLVILVLAASATLWWWPQGSDKALAVLLAVLVVSCPCALSLAIPAVYAAASSRLATAGVLLARPAVLERLPEVTHVLFDKTGTLTPATLRLGRVVPLGGWRASDALAIAAALEQNLQHPIARALQAAGQSDLHATEVALAEGGGVQGLVAGRQYRLGPPEPLGLDAQKQPTMADASCTWVALACDEEPIALFGLVAKARPEAIETVAALQAEGLTLRILSGDSVKTVHHLGEQLGIHRLHARQSPDQKLAHQRRLQAVGFVVMAVGDGINDAPLLAAADVSVAMPDGAALAQARADVILIGDSLAGLTLLRRIAAKARRRVQQNLVWALAYNLVMVPLAVSGSLTPWQAALGMSLSSLLVMANALRVGDGKPLATRERPDSADALAA